MENILNKYSKIIISGCQRSGTTIIGKMISTDLKYTYIDENEFLIDNWSEFKHVISTEKKVVIHCPALSHLLQYVRPTASSHSDCIIVWVTRPFNEIRDSMNRIDWGEQREKMEKLKYYRTYPSYSNFIQNNPIEKVKYLIWNEVQIKDLQVPYIVLDYHSDYVKNHSLFVDKLNRINFQPKQTC